MNCVVSGIVGIGMLGATYATMSVNEDQHNRLRDLFSPELDAIYNNIVNERRNQYMQGLIIGLIVAYFSSRLLKLGTIFHRLTFFAAIAIPFSVLYYFLMPKSDYMLNHLKTPEENKAWLKVYKTMQRRYIVGFILGSLAAVPISYALCW